MPRPGVGGARPDEAMRPEDFIRELFENERRKHVPEGHMLMEHLRDEPLSNEDVIGVTFGNRKTLQRLYDEGRVKPESDAHFRQALGMPPRQGQAAPALAEPRSLALHNAAPKAMPQQSQVNDAHEDWRIRQKPELGSTQPPAAAGQPQSILEKLPPSPEEVWQFATDTAGAAGTATSRAKSELLGNKSLHTGLTGAPAEAVKALTSNTDIINKPLEALGKAGHVIVNNRDLREKPIEALKKAENELLTNDKLHRGIGAAAEMSLETTKAVAKEAVEQIFWNAGPAVAAKIAERFQSAGTFVDWFFRSGGDVGKTMTVLYGADAYSEEAQKLARDLHTIAKKHGVSSR